MTTTPTDSDRQAAEKLLVQLRRTTSHSEGAGSINLPISALLHAISQAIADARAVKPGHVRYTDESGTHDIRLEDLYGETTLGHKLKAALAARGEK